MQPLRITSTRHGARHPDVAGPEAFRGLSEAAGDTPAVLAELDRNVARGDGRQQLADHAPRRTRLLLCRRIAGRGRSVRRSTVSSRRQPGQRQSGHCGGDLGALTGRLHGAGRSLAADPGENCCWG